MPHTEKDMVSISIDQIIATLSKVPFMGKALVNAALNRSSQSAKCDKCDNVAQVSIADIVQSPLTILSQIGFKKHARVFTPGGQPIVLTDPASSTSTSSLAANSTTAEDIKSAQVLLAQENQLPQNNPNNAHYTVEKHNPSSPAVKGAVSSDLKKPIVTAFHCDRPNCNGRLGIHCFKGDATDGDKQKLVDRIKSILTAMPDVVEASINAEKVKDFTLDDVFWVD